MGVINAILPILLMLILGYGCRRYWLTDPSFWKQINQLVYYVMFPCLMVYDIGRADLTGVNPIFVTILVAIVIVFMALIWLAKPLFADQRFWVAFIQGAVRYNSYVFIGLTFYYVGRNVMPIVALITAFLVITTNVISVFILNRYASRPKSLYKTAVSTLTNPLILSCILGLLVNKAAQSYPVIIRITWINNTFNNIGLASLALSLIGVGASLNLDSISGKLRGVLGCSFIKLILLPAVVIATLKALHFNPTLIEVCSIYAGSPCSSNATAMNQSMGGDYKSMSLIISVETALSMITLGLWLTLFHQGYL